MKILSVDDKDENLYMLEALLRGHGHEVDSASNGLDALRLAERGEYGLVIADILMPRMDGFQLCRELKKNERLRGIPFIFYTATYTDPRDEAFALSLGADRFLVKPLGPEAFIKNIEEVLAEARHRIIPAPIDFPEDEAIYLKEYNARLVEKLEKKMLDLEQANRTLQADIAERERAEGERAKMVMQLHQAQKMDAIGTLAGGIANDFNNILAGIMGFAELAQQDIRDPELTRSHLDNLARSAERARDLVKQILVFSRHRQSGRQPTKQQETIAETLRPIRAMMPSSIDLVEKVDSAAPPVMTDSTVIHQVVTNLVTNAWHSIGDRKGRIEIHYSAVDIDSDFARTHSDLRVGRYVRLSVSDTGGGMAPTEVDHIFEPFFTAMQPGRGPGLGLSVVHGIVKASDGAVSVDSEPGHGTTFHVYLPTPEAPTSTSTPPPSTAGSGQRVLFIDDEPILTTLGERFLKKLGYQVVTFNDPVAALECFKKEKFELVITDLTMPNLNGLDLGRQFFDLDPNVPVVLTTGYSATLDNERARALGFRDLLFKPFNIQTLGECLRRTFVPG